MVQAGDVSAALVGLGGVVFAMTRPPPRKSCTGRSIRGRGQRLSIDPRRPPSGTCGFTEVGTTTTTPNRMRAWSVPPDGSARIAASQPYLWQVEIETGRDLEKLPIRR